MNAKPYVGKIVHYYDQDRVSGSDVGEWVGPYAAVITHVFRPDRPDDKDTGYVQLSVFGANAALVESQPRMVRLSEKPDVFCWMEIPPEAKEVLARDARRQGLHDAWTLAVNIGHEQHSEQARALSPGALAVASRIFREIRKMEAL